MKKKIGLLFALIALSFATNAQVFDLTTGTGGVGVNDPIWTMQGPGGGGFGPIIGTTGTLQAGGSTWPNTYAQDNCGRWISPWTNAANNIINTPGTAGTFTYRMTFVVDDCVINPVASLNLPFAAADNTLTDLRVNGISQPIPAGISFNPASSITGSPAVVNGVNTIDVDVNNVGSFTALMLCGDITVTSGTNTVPQRLDCCVAASGEVLSWAPVAGAVGYQVEIIWNDPECCETSELPYSSLYNVTGNSFVLPSPTTCHSWRVRTVMPGNCYSDWSEKLCGCYPIEKCSPPIDFWCDRDESGFHLGWSPVAGVSNYLIEVVFNDPLCCETTELPFAIQASTLSNYYFVNDSKACFSWRVRSYCPDGSLSAWSAWQCSCNGKSMEPSDEGSTHIQQGYDAELELMPNPADAMVTINVLTPATPDKTGECNLNIIDLSGAVVHYSTVNFNQRNQVDVSSLKPGVYFCNVTSQKGVIASEKLIIK